MPPSRTAAPSSAPALQFPGSAAPASKGRRGQPADGCPIHAIGASDLSLRLAGRQPRQGLLTLERVELRFATELHAASLRTHPAGVRSILDEFALELRKSAEDGQHQPAMRRGGICPSIPDRPEAGARLADLV